jgi:TetR/AcrR family transcriptional regulator
MNKSGDLRGTRERILAAALNEFAEHGLAGARVDRIATRAGINKAMIYYHFDSKQALYDHTLMAMMEAGVSRLSAQITEGVGLEDILRAIARFHYESFQPDDRLSRIMLRELAGGGESIKRLLPQLAGKEDLRVMIVRAIEDGKRHGRYRDVDTRQAVISFVGMSLLYLMIAPMANQVWGIDDDTQFRKQRPDAIVDLFLYGLEAR